MNDAMIDLARDWIESRKGAYLAKENVLVYYTSHTGRKSDYAWVSLSLPEVVRIITATQMDASSQRELNQSHVITACQELDRVFEFGMRSRHKLASGIFNYITEAGQDVADAAMEMLAKELHSDGYRAMLYMQVKTLYCEIDHLLKIQCPARQITDLIHKHFTILSYEVRVEQYRPEVRGKKQPAIMQPGTRPKEIVDLSEETCSRLKKRIYGALK